MSENRVAIYIRVSTLHQIDKDSLPMQRADLSAYSKLILNTDDYVIFEDAGYSGKNTDRPQYQEMMTQIRKGLFTHLLVWKIDRISRNLIDFSTMYQELKSLGVTFVSKNEQFDTSTAVGEAMLKIILVFAELERKMTAERVASTMVSRAGKGLWNGGRVPFGYEYNKKDNVFSINEAEADIVHRIYDEYEETKSITTIIRALNSEGITTRSGKTWSATTAAIILNNVFYTGDYLYNAHGSTRQDAKDKSEWIVCKDHHPAIITHEQRDRVLKILNKNRKLPDTRSKKRIHVFADKIRCSCGRIMSPRIVTNKGSWVHSSYVCLKRSNGECDGASVNDTIVGEYAINFILNILNAKKNRYKIKTAADLEEYLISGSCFSHVESIKKGSLDELFAAIKSMSKTNFIFDEDYRNGRTSSSGRSSVANLKAQRTKHKQALDRLTDLYLYSSAAMPEQEYISRREALELKINDLNTKILELSASNSIIPMPQIDYEQMAGRYIITEQLKNKSHINYKRLAMDIDAEILKDFFDSIIDMIDVKNGLITRIAFRNGLSADFNIKTGAKRFALVRNR